jgi:hypothetical protein
MNKHQEHHHGLHHHDHSEDPVQSDISNPATGETGDHESALDELEKTMFERAR